MTAVAAAALLVLMLTAWALSLVLRDVSIVDSVWGLAFVVVAWISFVLGDAGLWISLLVSVWGLRLAGYIAWRKLRERREDPRYGAWRERWGAHFAVVSLFTVFLFQGLIVLVVSLPIQAADAGFGWVDGAGVALFAVGLFFETVGDAQLARFKSDPANRGKVMDRGLWRYTRHPNYFGDFCVWWGLWLMSGAWWTVIGPLVMTLLLTRVSGKDHLERHMSERPGYAEYVARTSGFVPRPPHGRIEA